MSLKDEIYNDINSNCDILLGILKDKERTNDTPEGRMIFQCLWLKEQIIAKKLPLPVTEHVNTLKHVAAENLLEHLASNEHDYWNEIGIYLYRLLFLVDGKPLIKPSYYFPASNLIDGLINLLEQSPRALDDYEQGLTSELQKMKERLFNNEMEPPLGSSLPDYPNFNKVNRYQPTIEDIHNGKYLIKTVANLIFNGVRPGTWFSPEQANIEVTALLT